MANEETCTHGSTPLMCVECTELLVFNDPIARRAYLENRDARVREDALRNGWLIETSGPMFYGRCGWGTAGDAIRFMRKVDAEACIKALSLRCRAFATEHSWCA